MFFYSTGKQRRLPIERLNVILLPTVITAIIFFSMIAHKEFRFILPLSPMITFIALQQLSAIKSQRAEKVVKIILIVFFSIATTFFGIVHQRGTLVAVKELATEAAENPNSTSLLFLMPCHSTPLYSHLHVPVKVKFIECEPPLTPDKIDESVVFFSDPLSWLNTYWKEKSNVPSHIVLYDVLDHQIKSFLTDHHFQLWSVIFHTLLPEDRVGGKILIYKSTYK